MMLSTIIRSFWLVFFAGYFVACNAQPGGTSLEPLAFRDAYAKEKQAVLLDVRTPSEGKGGILPNAVLGDYQATDFETRILKMNRDLPYFVYCLSGGRSGS
ncbi:MAG: rhodanese-like domain-containing protein, partial [Ferruginibacter sp.]